VNPLVVASSGFLSCHYSRLEEIEVQPQVRLMGDIFTYAVKVKQQRKALGMRQKDLAAAVNRCVGTVQAWEQGRKTPSREAVAALAEALKVSADDINSWIAQSPPTDRS